MKKLIAFFAVCAVSLVGYAQRNTTTDYLNAQARIPQAFVQPIVKPLVTEVEVLKDYKSKYLVSGHKFSISLTKKQVENDLAGNLTDVHNYGVYLLSDDIGCDMIVAPIYNLYTNTQGGYTLEIKGFPANFKNWRTCTPEDYNWMKIDETIRLSTDPTIYTKMK